MYIIRPLNVTMCKEKWVVSNAVTINDYSSPDYDTSEWSAQIYAEDSSVNYLGYDFLSVVSTALNPKDNYIGRPPKIDDGEIKNQAVWVRKGFTNKIKCFVPLASGFTESVGAFSGVLTIADITNTPELLLMPQETLYLLSHGVIANNLTVQSVSYSGQVIAQDTITIPESSQSEPDYIVSPELPSRAKTFIYPSLCGTDSENNNAVTDRFSFAFTPTTTAFSNTGKVFVEGIIPGRLSYIGITQWTDYNTQALDRSKFTEDNFGVVSISRRSGSKQLVCKIILHAEDIADKIYHVERLLMSLRGTLNYFIPTNVELKSLPHNELSEIAYSDIFPAIIKTHQVSDVSYRSAVLTLTVETVPTGYRV